MPSNANSTARRTTRPTMGPIVASARSVSRMVRSLLFGDPEQKTDASRDRQHGERACFDFVDDLLHRVTADGGSLVGDGFRYRAGALADAVHDASQRLIDEVGDIAGAARDFALGAAANAAKTGFEIALQFLDGFDFFGRRSCNFTTGRHDF